MGFAVKSTEDLPKKRPKSRPEIGPKVTPGRLRACSSQGSTRYHAPAALERLGRFIAHQGSWMHAWGYLKSGKVKKHVKRDPTKGPTGQKRTKNGQKSTKTGQRVPHKQAKIEEDCENEHAAVMNHPRHRRYDHDEAIHAIGGTITTKPSALEV